MRQVRLYTTGPACSLCERTERDLRRLEARGGFRLEVVDLREAPAPAPDYVFRTPVVHLDGRRVAEGRIDPATLERVLGGAVASGGSASTPPCG